MGALLVVLLLGCGDEGGPAIQSVRWHVEGLSEGALRLVETHSGRAWSAVSEGTTRRTREDISFERVSEGWEFELEVLESSALECDMDGGSGRYDELWDDGTAIYVFVRCGIPITDVVVPDRGLAECLADLPTVPANTRHLELLDCSHRHVRDLTGLEHFFALWILKLDHNEIERFDTLDIAVFRRLRQLDLSYNFIGHATSGTIDLNHFEPFHGDLDLSFNLIVRVGRLQDLSLDRLSLRENFLTDFEIERPYLVAGDAGSYADGRHTSFMHLDLGRNHLTELDLRNLSHLPLDLRVDHNSLERLHLGIEGHPYIGEWLPTHVDASFNRLSAAPLDAESRRLEPPMDGVEELNLSHNQFASIPVDYITPKTRTLIASDNFITSIDLSQATALERLDLSTNFLSPIDLSDAPALLAVDLSDNGFFDFDWNLTPTELETLDLSSNEIQLEDCSASNLRHLKAEDTWTSSLDLSGCPALERIELADNGLHTLDLSTHTAIEHVDLQDNPLSCAAVAAIGTQQPDAEFLHGPDPCIP